MWDLVDIGHYELANLQYYLPQLPLRKTQYETTQTQQIRCICPDGSNETCNRNDCQRKELK